MIRIAVIAANQTEDIELVTPVDIWRRAGIIVRVISVEKKKNVILAHGTKVSCDEVLAKENLAKYNGLYLPGGKGWTKFNEIIAPKLVTFCQKNAKNKKVTFMAACAAPEFFVKYDMLSPNAKITCYPSQVDEKIKQHYVKKNVVISDNFITTAGPGTVAEFAIEVVKKFISPSKASEINKAMLYI